MALHGNPFLGKLKIPAPDLSHIPETAFESRKPALNESQSAHSPVEALPLGIDSSRSHLPNSPIVDRQDKTQRVIDRRPKSEDKLETNRGQTGDKTRDKLETNRGQTEDILLQSDPFIFKTRDKLETKLETHLETKQRQTGDKLETNSTISSLVGLQRELLFALYDSCKRNRSRMTEPLAVTTLAQSLETSSSSVKKTIQRLEKKALIERADFKNGRSGWTSYSLPDSVFREVLQLETEDKLKTNWRQTRDKVGTKLETQPETTLSSSSSSIDLQKFKTTTTDDTAHLSDGVIKLSPEWRTVEYSPISEFGFTQSHLIQLARHGKLSASEVQDSIYFFAFDLKRNGKANEIKGAPLNFFMGILRKGLPYAPPENYESPETEVRRRYLEGKRRLEEQRVLEERELEVLEFTQWRRDLRPEELFAIVPEVIRHVPRASEESLKAHFRDNVWPTLRSAASEEWERAEVRKQIDHVLGEAIRKSTGI